MEIVIINDHGWFLKQANNKNLVWGEEYPDAILFEEHELKAFFKNFKTALFLAGAKAISDYGLDTEKEIA